MIIGTIFAKAKADTKEKVVELEGEGDGRATKVRHNSDHGNPKYHTNPHDHDITWTTDGNPSFGNPVNYPNGASLFK